MSQQVTNEFYPFDHCKLRLDLAKYASFSTPLESIIADSAANGSNEETSPDWPSPPPPGCLDPDQLDEDLLRRSRTLVITAGRQSVVPLLVSFFPSCLTLFTFADNFPIGSGFSVLARS